jgi:HD-like signal output (HDOD) protein
MPSAHDQDITMQPHAKTNTDLDRWFKRLSDCNMPVLGNTVQRICQASADRASSASDLAAVVLQDAAMTSRVLKLANSAYYNPSGLEISTISRAVIMLGFDTVRSIGLSVAVVDTFLRGPAKSKVVGLMRQAVYAAVQAKAIAKQSGDPAPEEIFIAALLYHLGDMAFWSFADEQEARALDDALAHQEDPAKAELTVLGCTLRMLTLELAREWRLSEVLQEALQTKTASKGRGSRVLLGHELEAAVREHGWDSAAARLVTDKIASHIKLPPERARALISGSRRELEQAAQAFGVTLDLQNHASEAPGAVPTQVARPPDPMLQLKILRELSAALDKKPDIQLILDMVMEGIYRGIAMERALLAVLTPDRRSLRVKYVLGDADNRLADALRLDLAGAEGTFFRAALAGRSAVWHGSADTGLESSLSAEMRATLAESFFIAPLVVRDRDIGLIYADCRPSGRPLDAEAFSAFQHFIAQANISLEHLARR